jgi:hypothetical protein
MNQNQITVLLVAIILVGLTIVFFQNRRRTIENEIRDSIDAKYPFPVEVLYGTYLVLSKSVQNHVSVIRVDSEGKHLGFVIEVTVPPRMHKRLIEGVAYSFYYDYKMAEICFIDLLKRTEQSNYSLEEMKKFLFPLKARILERINQ